MRILSNRGTASTASIRRIRSLTTIEMQRVAYLGQRYTSESLAGHYWRAWLEELRIRAIWAERREELRSRADLIQQITQTLQGSGGEGVKN